MDNDDILEGKNKADTVTNEVPSSSQDERMRNEENIMWEEVILPSKPMLNEWFVELKRSKESGKSTVSQRRHGRVRNGSRKGARKSPSQNAYTQMTDEALSDPDPTEDFPELGIDQPFRFQGAWKMATSSHISKESSRQEEKNKDTEGE